MELTGLVYAYDALAQFLEHLCYTKLSTTAS